MKQHQSSEIFLIDIESLSFATQLGMGQYLQERLLNNSKMQNLTQFIKEMDLFAHSQLLRYRSEESYRTITGGIVSLLLIGLFIGIFWTLVISTFSYSLITSQSEIIYEADPTPYQLMAHPSSKFMFAIGINGVDLSTSKLFDIELNRYTQTRKNSSSSATIDKAAIVLQPCTADQWSGISSNIENSYDKLKLSQWLCPISNSVIPLEGKYTSDIFKYSRLTVARCSTSLNKTCSSQEQFSNFTSQSQGVITVSVYFANALINAGSELYMDYYLEDQNYLKANVNQGVEADLFFNEYNIETDNSILPWAEKATDSGIYITSQALTSAYPLSLTSSTVYAKIFFRKGSSVHNFVRGFQKFDETLSYIGGLFGFIMILFSVFSLYDKYAYEIEFGDRIFKQNELGSYGSEKFNFVVYLGYCIFNLLGMLGCKVNWKEMKQYHECREESQKQLDVHLLFKKITFFEEVSKVLLDDFYIWGLNLIPKPTVREIRERRRIFQIQTMMYHQLERKGRVVFIEEADYQKRLNSCAKQRGQFDFLKQMVGGQGESEPEQMAKAASSYKKLQQECRKGDKLSRRILDRIEIKDACKAILNFALDKNNHFRPEGQRSIRRPLQIVLKAQQREFRGKESISELVESANNLSQFRDSCPEE